MLNIEHLLISRLFQTKDTAHMKQFLGNQKIAPTLLHLTRWNNFQTKKQSSRLNMQK